MSEKVDSCPHQDTHGYNDVEGQGMCQWEDLQEMWCIDVVIEQLPSST